MTNKPPPTINGNGENIVELPERPVSNRTMAKKAMVLQLDSSEALARWMQRIEERLEQLEANGGWG